MPDRNWLLERINDAAIAISAAGTVIHANRAAHSLAARVSPGDANPKHLVALVPTDAVAGARADGVWKGVTSVAHLQIDLDLELHTAERGSTAIFRQRGFESDQASQSEAQLRHSDRLMTLGQLAAGVAHEVNNPISYAQSNLRVMEEYGESLQRFAIEATKLIEASGDAHATATLARLRDENEIDHIARDLPSLLRESRNGLQQVGSLMGDLRGFARERGGEMAPADLTAAVVSSLSMLDGFLKFKGAIQREFSPVPPIECCIDQLQQVIVNLLMNAGQAMQSYGTITVTVGASDDEAWVGVADTGDGIPTERLARIFDPYYTTKPLGQGTGIGLAICYSIIARHRGRIEVASRVGEGTRFRIVVPIRQPLPGRIEAA